MDICKLESCERPKRTAGYCNAHYLRWNRYGDPLASKPKKSFDEKFWERVDKTDECWIWTAAKTPAGYGVQRDGKLIYAHRYSYMKHKGEIEQGLVIDHVCHNRACVKPDHLRAVTQKQNTENHSGATRVSKTGIRGVCWDSGNKRWLAQVKHGDRNVFFKHFTTIEEAEAAVIDARLKFHTHNDMDRVAA